jgi:hypothetical protein
MHYVKLWSNLLKSSILEQDLHVRWLWIAMLLEADRDGNVYGTPEALARVANMNLDQVNAALAILTAPDPNSTTGDEQGRRILPVGTNLWYLVNYQSYRGLKDMEEIRRKTAERVRRHRERKRVQAVTHSVTLDVTQSNPIVLRAEAEAEAKTTKTLGRSAPKRVTYSEDFLAFWKLYPNKTAKGNAWESWQRRAEPVPSLAVVLAAVERDKSSKQWRKDAGEFIPYPATWLNQRQWENEGSEHRSRSGLVLPPLKGVT